MTPDAAAPSDAALAAYREYLDASVVWEADPGGVGNLGDLVAGRVLAGWEDKLAGYLADGVRYETTLSVESLALYDIGPRTAELSACLAETSFPVNSETGLASGTGSAETFDVTVLMVLDGDRWKVEGTTENEGVVACAAS